jgi:hypothetical protein
LIELREAEITELGTIYNIAIEEHARLFLNSKSMNDHKREFSDMSMTHLSIVDASNTILGYFILVKSDKKYSVQLKRILISKDKFGIGQYALIKLEEYCNSIMSIKHIWLDVYDDNYKAIHIYKKLGYRLFNSEIEGDRKILHYDKSL